MVEDEDTASADAAILLNLQVEERVVSALTSVATKDPRLSLMLAQLGDAADATRLRMAITCLIVDVMRSSEFRETLYRDLKSDMQRGVAIEAERARQQETMMLATLQNQHLSGLGMLSPPSSASGSVIDPTIAPARRR